MGIFKASQRVVQHGRFIPELDGLRFVAILSVLIFHANERMIKDFGIDLGAASGYFKTGAFGVQVFFAISGFILAKQILESRAFSYKSYLYRRIRRIEPPFVIAIVVQTLLLSLVFKPELAKEYWRSFWWVISYTSNINGFNIINGVTWSLEIEVQFYLLLPLVIWLLRQVDRYLRFPWALLLGSAAVFLLIRPMIPFRNVLSYVPFFSVGILVAWLRVHNALQQVRFPAWVSTLLVLGLFALRTKGIALEPDAKRILSLILMFLLFHNVLVVGRSPKWLSNLQVTTLGGMCYTIYLYHMVILSAFSTIILPWMHQSISATPLFYWLGMVLMVAVSLSVSFVPFLLFEKPFMYRNWTFPPIRSTLRDLYPLRR